MGEIADGIVDDMLSRDWRDDCVDDDGPFGGRRLPPIPRCRNCGEPLTFELNRNGRWVPRSDDGGPHNCRSHATADEFGPIA